MKDQRRKTKVRFPMMIRLFFPFLIGVFVLNCSPKKKEAPAENVPTKGLPNITVKMLSGEVVMTNSLKGKTILFFYSPDCDHCQREAKDIGENSPAFKEYAIYLICSPRPNELIAGFQKEFGLENQPNLHFGQAEVENVVGEMGSIGTPSLFIYSEEGKLVKRIDNETPASEIIKFL